MSGPIDIDEWNQRTAERTLEFVRLGYSDIIDDDSLFRSMNFTTDCLETKYLIPAIRLVKTFNSFDGAAVAEGLARFSGRVSCAEFGRSDSPILWLHFPAWTHQRENVDSEKSGERISDAEFESLKEEARRIFVNELNADGFGVHETLNRKVWIWWD
jgi:hypothetical protein